MEIYETQKMQIIPESGENFRNKYINSNIYGSACWIESVNESIACVGFFLHISS